MTKKKIQNISRLLQIIRRKGRHGVQAFIMWSRKIDELFTDKALEKEIRNLICTKQLSTEQTKFTTALFELILEGEQREWNHKHIDDLRRFTREYLLEKIASEGACFEEPFLSAIDCQRALLQRKVTLPELAAAKTEAFKNLLLILQQSETLERARLALYGLCYAVSEVDEYLCAKLSESLDFAASIPGIEGDYLFISARRWTRIRLSAESKAPFTLKHEERSRLICVASTKGGVGKSIIAATLAYCLALKKRRVCIVEVDTTGPALLWQLDWEDQFFHRFKGESFPFFHSLLINKDFDNIDCYMHKVFFPQQPECELVYLVAGSFRPNIVDGMESYWQTGPRASQQDSWSLAIEEVLRILIKDKRFDHVILDLSPGMAGTASLAVRAIVAIGGCMVLVARSRAADIVNMALGADLLGPTQDQERAAIIINGVRPSLKKIKDINYLESLLKKHSQTLAYFEGFSPKMAWDAIRTSLTHIRIQDATLVEEVPELRFLNEPGKCNGLFSLLKDDAVREKVAKPIDAVLECFGTCQYEPKRY